MIKFSNLKLSKMIIHHVGNKSRDESNFVSRNMANVNDDFKKILKKYFLKSFNNLTETYHFIPPSANGVNELAAICQDVFNDEGSFYDSSVKILNSLFEKSNHPHIKSGELFITIFEDIEYMDELVSGIGIFKAETYDDFITIIENPDELLANSDNGIPVKKLDKGCIVLNVSDADGFRLLSVDNNNYDAEYWKNNFLGVEYIQDENYATASYLHMCQSFANEVIAKDESKKEQIEFLNQSMDYFESQERIDSKEFAEALFPTEKLQEQFKEYKVNYENEHDLIVADDFEISKPVLKKQKRSLKNLIKLDTNIQIKLDVNNEEFNMDFVEQGYDNQKGMRFYKVYYHEEWD